MTATTTPTTERNKAVVRRFFQAFADNDEATLKEVAAPDLVAYSHGDPQTQNREAHLYEIRAWNAAFDTDFVVEEQIAEGDVVATRVTMRSVHNRGDFQGIPPSGNAITLGAVSVERLRGGQITERRVYADWLGMMRQLGLIPPPQVAQ